MDRNTITGIALIAIILIGSYMFFGEKKPAGTVSKNKADSSHTIIAKKDSGTASLKDSSKAGKSTTLAVDSTKPKTQSNVPAGWEGLTHGENKEYTIENENLKLKISSKGGKINYAELKKYKTFDKRPLLLLDSASNKYGFEFSTGAIPVSTEDLYFTPTAQTPTSIEMTAALPGGKAIKQVYTLSKEEPYVVGNQLTLVGMNEVIPRNTSYLNLEWESKILKNEQDSTISRDNTTIHYRNKDETPSSLSDTKDAEEKFKKETDWVSFKQQFFCQALISTKQPFEDAHLVTSALPGTKYNKELKAVLTFPFNHSPSQTFDMKFYLGPLHYKTLSKMDLDLERQIPLGWSFFITSWVNRFLVIPIFNFLSNFISNFGIIILLLTVIIKLIVLPLTYKSYLSTAKMKVLKPELDELKEKFGKEPTKMQAEQMKLYRKAGVSPFGGCLPLLLQFPILIAMFRFFPSSIELRQESFLWAKDLSTYDSIYHIPYNIPIITSFYGDHVSLFTILMTISTLIYTRLNNSISPQQNEFKWLSYLMPIFFLGLFNKYSAGLSMYYFFFNILTFLQQYLFKKFIDEKKLLAQIEENKKKPSNNKKSKLQQRLEEMQKRQQQQVRRK
jgi:YidC/Oxa1 family membrane protein insertase